MDNNEILFAKIKDNAVIPTKRDEDAGFDIFPCFDGFDLKIRPGEIAMIPTGICSAFSNDKVIVLKERGSTGTKGIEQRSGVIDSGFRGEWIVPVTNGTNKNMVITKSENPIEDYIQNYWTVIPYRKAIAQAIVLDIPHVHSVEVSPDEIYSIYSERGKGMLGSTDKE